ncbi:TPA: cation:dicarboxylate symporter family transporter [Klebsiella michiganensis]
MKLVGTVYLGLILFVLMILGGICALIGENMFRLTKHFRQELVLAFSSAAYAASCRNS